MTLMSRVICGNTGIKAAEGKRAAENAVFLPRSLAGVNTGQCL